jgi:regulatory protein
MRRRSRTRIGTPIEIPTGRITAITPSGRTTGRFDLIVDGEPAARLSIDGIERLRLYVGREIGESDIETITAEAETSRTYDRALAMLATRGRASGELKRLLVRKGESARVVDQAIARLQAAGFLDDAAFARQFTRYRAVAGGLSRRRIERELRQRGIDRATATAAIEQTFVEEGVDEAAALEQVAERKLRSLSRLDVQTKRRRLYSFLVRRGHDVDAISQVVRHLTKVSVERG